VYNQDDCLAVNSGTQITFTGGYCSGGHGLSIGSVGGRSDNTVDTVNILDSQIVNSDNGVRIKTVSGATGKVTGVTYSNIKLSNVSPNYPPFPVHPTNSLSRSQNTAL
jgi:polygalacturonase